jgi:DUF4097 and DUF4098 domain-containing protein YvlB
MTTWRRLTPLVLAFAFAVPGSAGAQRGGDRVDTTLALDRGGSVHLGLISGEIRVVGEARSDVRIVAHTEGGRFETSFSRSRIAINTRSVNGRQGVTRFDVTVPAGTRVTASSISGSIEVRGTAGEVVARSTSGTVIIRDATDRIEAMSISGDIEMRNVKGRIRAETTSGDVRVDDASGEMSSETVSGNTSLRRSAFDGIRASAVSGSITYEGPLARDGSYRLNVHSGNVLLVVPANVAATLELETFSGRITTDFPLVLQPGSSDRRGRRMEFTLGAGGARVVAGAFSGNITIRRGDATGNRE